MAPLRAAGPRLAEPLRDMPFAESGSIHNEPDRPHAYTADNAMLRGLDSAAMREVLDLTGPEAPVSRVGRLRHLGGALSRPPALPNAVGHRGAEHLLSVISPLDGSDPGDARSVHGRVIAALAPLTLGRCLNYMYGEKPTVEGVRTAYDADDYRRLAELKAVYDPANTFRFNHNIPPSDGRGLTVAG